MTIDFRLAPPLLLSHRQELDTLEAASLLRPASLHRRLAMAGLMLKLDRFAPVVEILAALTPAERGYRGAMMLGAAHLALGGKRNDAAAAAVFEEAVASAETPALRAEALADAAKAATRLANETASMGMLREALRLDPQCRNAAKRLATQLLGKADFTGALALADELIGQGAVNSRNLSTRTLALAALDRIDEARETLSLDRFLMVHGEEQAADDEAMAFDRALSEELLGHPDRREYRYGAASVETVRVDFPLRNPNSMMARWQDRTIAAIQRYAAALPTCEHPFATSRPRKATLRFWSVMTRAAGHELWHMHQGGWLSGVYYPQVPDVLEGSAGGLQFGLAPDLIGERAAARFGNTLVKPAAGLGAMFPSFAYHRTIPHGGAGWRICIAFDVTPLEAMQ